MEETQIAHLAKNIGVQDIDSLFTETDVEGVLKELFTFADSVHQNWTDVRTIEQVPAQWRELVLADLTAIGVDGYGNPLG